MKPVWYHILLAMAEGPSHGAEIQRRVHDHSGGSVKVYPAMLYGSLDALTEMGWIEETQADRRDPEQTRWRFYALTSEGRRSLEAETARLETVLSHARAALGRA